MDEATANVSTRTRRLIEHAQRRGNRLGVEVATFGLTVREALAAFDSEADPLRLSDDDYNALVVSSGMDVVLTTTRRLGDFLGSLIEDAA